MFKLGQIVATSTINETLTAQQINRYICRHHNGDWGDLDEEDKAMNQSAVLNEDDRIFSMYQLPNDKKIYVITEWDHSVTTVLYSDEY